MPAFLGSDGSFPLQFAIIFVVIFVVLAALVLLIRRFTGRGTGSAAKSGPRPRQPRLGIVDVYELDRQRQLILLRRDNVEHLLLVGGPNDVVVERNISRGGSARLAADEALPEESAAETASDFDPPLRAPAFSQREPGPPIWEAKAPEIAAERRMIGEPSLTETPRTLPSVVPPMPSSDSQPPAVEPLRAGRNDETVAVPVAARREPQPARILRRTPPPLVNPKPDVASERSRAAEPQSPGTASSAELTTREPDFEAAFAAALATPAARAAVTPATTQPVEPSQPPKIGKVDAGVLSDMARQLEEAVRRPSPAVTAPPSVGAAIPAVDLAQDPVPAEPPPPDVAVDPTPDIPLLPPPSVPMPVDDEARVQTEPQEPEAPTDPMAAAMASAADTPPDGDDLFEDSAPMAESEPKPEPEPRPAPEPEPTPAPPESAKPPAAPASTNPFSVEEIEAEFARLLGRPLDRKN